MNHLAVTALFIATKYEEIYPPDLVELISYNSYEMDETEIFKKELAILRKLDFELLTVSPYIFLVRYHAIIDDKNTILFNLAQLILEFSLLNPKFCHFKNSLKAAASLYTAFNILNLQVRQKDFWNNDFKFFSGYELIEIMPAYSIIVSYIKSESLNFRKLEVFSKFYYSYQNVSQILLDYSKSL